VLYIISIFLNVLVSIDPGG